MGKNSFGQLGLGGGGDKTSPVIVPAFSGVADCFARNEAVAFLMLDGRAFVAGQNDYGQLGIGSKANQPTPIQVPLPGLVVSIGAGYKNFIWVLDDGSVWGAGNCHRGELGQGEETQTGNDKGPGNWPIFTNPVQFVGLGAAAGVNVKMASISGYQAHFLVQES